MKKCIQLFCLICLLFVPFIIHAEDYDINRYEVTIDIEKNHSILVEENYTVYANQLLKNIDRNLKYVYPGETSTQRTSLKNINVDNINSIIYVKNNGKIVKMETDIKPEEILDVHLNYQRNLETTDELFIPIIDGTFDTTINNVYFQINLKEPITENDIQFYMDGQRTNKVSYQLEGTTILGSYDNLEKGQTLSLALLLPNYFNPIYLNTEYIYIITLFIPIVGLLYGIYVWIRYGHKNKITKEETIFPPNQFDPAEVSFLYNGYTKKSDLIAILLLLATSGYIKIIQSPTGTTIKKIKPYDGKNALQKTIYDEIFNEKEMLTYEELKEYFLNNSERLKGILDNKEHKNQIFQRKYKTIARKLYLLLLLGTISTVGLSMYHVFQQYLIPLIIILLFYLGIILFVVKKGKLLIQLIGFIFLILSVGINGYYLYVDITYLIIFLIGVFFLLIIAFILRSLSPRTSYGNEMWGRVNGFRNILYYMSITKLKEINDDSKDYFYEMLPYAYALRFYDKWIMSGYQVITDLPTWFVDANIKDLKTLRQSLQSFLKELELDSKKKR